MTWNEAKGNANKLTEMIEKELELKPPKSIRDVLSAVNTIDKETGAIPNPAPSGMYGQLILYPSKKWNTWGRISMSISKYGV